MKSLTSKKYLFSNTDLRKLIVPLIFEQALAITVGMADTIMISSAGEAAVSGVSLVDMLNMLIFGVLAAISTGGCVVVSQSLGAQKQKQACTESRQVLYTVLFFSIIIAVLMVGFRNAVLNLFFGKIDENVMEACLTYLIISSFSFPFLGIYNSCAALFRAMGKTNITFIVSIIGNIINITGNAILIFGFHMGVAGVAIPTLVSRIIMALILYVLLKNKKLEIHFEKEKFNINFNIVKKILYIGIPSGIENGIFQLGRVLVVSIISSFGTIQIAANGVANSLDSMGCIIGQAMNLAMITVIGRCVGANDKEQISYYTKKLLLITYVATAIVNSTILLLLSPILKLYGLTSETTELTRILVLIHNGMAIFMWPLSFVLPNMLRACNDVKFPMFISIFSMFLFRVGLSYILGSSFGMGAIGVWIAMLVDWLFRIICFVLRYIHGNWKTSMYKLSK